MQEQAKIIAQLVEAPADNQTRIYVFGLKLNHEAHGRDVDMMLDFGTPVESTALLTANISAKISRLIYGRKVDILLSAKQVD